MTVRRRFALIVGLKVWFMVRFVILSARLWSMVSRLIFVSLWLLLVYCFIFLAY